MTKEIPTKLLTIRLEKELLKEIDSLIQRTKVMRLQVHGSKTTIYRMKGKELREHTGKTITPNRTFIITELLRNALKDQAIVKRIKNNEEAKGMMRSLEGSVKKTVEKINKLS